MVKEGQLIWPTIITCIAIITLNCLYRWPLYEEGVQQIIWMQDTQSTLLSWLFISITTIIEPVVIALFCLLILIANRKKQKGIIMIMFVLVNVYFTSVLKAYYADPRPFWTNKYVKSIGPFCPVEFGNPSGHSWFASIFGFGIVIDYWGIGHKYINIWISIIIVILVPISRMYLGAHSLNQVFQGLAIGLAMCLLYVLKIKNIISSLLKTFYQKSIWKFIIIVAHVIYIIPFIAHRKQELPVQWLNNIKQQCGLQLNLFKINSIMFVVNATLVNIMTGIVLGYKNISKVNNGLNYLTGKWQINQQKYQLLKGYIIFFTIEYLCIFSGLIIALIIVLIFTNVIVGYVVFSFGGLISGYMYTGKTCYLLGKYKVIREIQCDD